MRSEISSCPLFPGAMPRTVLFLPALFPSCGTPSLTAPYPESGSGVLGDSRAVSWIRAGMGPAPCQPEVYNY